MHVPNRNPRWIVSFALIALAAVVVACNAAPQPTATLEAAPTEEPARTVLPAATDTALPPATDTALPPTETQAPAASDTPLPTEPAAATATQTGTPTLQATATITATAGPSPTPAPSFTPTATPDLGSAAINIDLLYLRDGPSRLYATLGSYRKGAKVAILGKARGDEWVRVLAPGSKTGWMAAEFLDLPITLDKIPAVEVDYSVVISGSVTLAGDTPAPGILVAVFPKGNEALLTDTKTSADGKYYLYLPPNVQGLWNVAITGVDCKSPVVGADCSLAGYINTQDQVQIELPPKELVTFTYEKTTNTLKGKLTGKEGQAVNDLRIFARRSDGASSWGKTSAAGEFTLPTASGSWEVYVIAPQGEGPHVTVEVSDQTPEPVELKMP